MNALSLRCPRSPRRQAPRALRERLECSEGGDTGRRTRVSYLVGRSNTRMAVRSAPGRGRAEWVLIRAAGEERQGYRGKGYSGSAGGLGGPLDQLGEPHRQFDAFADLLVAGPGGSGGFTQLLYAGEERLHVLAQQLLPERQVGSRAGE